MNDYAVLILCKKGIAEWLRWLCHIWDSYKKERGACCWISKGRKYDLEVSSVGMMNNYKTVEVQGRCNIADSREPTLATFGR
jgi:hypothetical protein